MLDVRPTSSARYLDRPRLLELLPDGSGRVVWAEAPYGYGKSVLADQWARALEAGGGTVLWLSLAGQRPAKQALSSALNLPSTAPWSAVLDELWRTTTLLVLEELDGTEELDELLRRVDGLLLLASRSHLPYPALAQLETAGRLTRLTGTDLAFTHVEAEELFDDPERASSTWRATHGWPLPLHFASLSDEFPSTTTLIGGVKRSVSEAAWHELLLLAAAEWLPNDATVDATRELARAGFVQQLGAGYRLHPLVSTGLREAYSADVSTELRNNAARLPPAVRGAAFERCGELTELGEFLEGPDAGLTGVDPADYLRWHELSPAGQSPALRQLRITLSRLLLNSFDVAAADSVTVLGEAALEEVVRAQFGHLAANVLTSAGRLAEARALIPPLEALASSADPLAAGFAHRGLSFVALRSGDLPGAVRLCRASLDAFRSAPRSQDRDNAVAEVTVNLLEINWEADGVITGAVDTLLALTNNESLDESPRALAGQNASIRLAMLGDYTAAAAQLRRVDSHYRHASKLLVKAMLAFLELDLRAFPVLLATARNWEQYDLSDRVGALWLRALRRTGDATTGLRIRDTLVIGAFTSLELVWVLQGAGREAEAEELFRSAQRQSYGREFKLHLLAADYLLHRSAEALDELTTLTNIGERILPYVLIPLNILPNDRPELAAPYPTEAVLASGWTEATKAISSRIPPLEVRLLGAASVFVLGEDVHLSGRQLQLVALLATGFTRDETAEALWPEVDTERQRNNMNVQLNHLRKRLEPWGVPTYVTREGLTNFRTDVAELRAALDARDAAAALKLYREPLFGSSELPELEEVAAELRRATLRLLVEAARAAEPEHGVALLKRALELEPLDEDVLQLLLEALNARGRTSEARRHFDAFSSLLEREVGGRPLERTIELAGGRKAP